jgi:hypothetical protein
LVLLDPKRKVQCSTFASLWFHRIHCSIIGTFLGLQNRLHSSAIGFLDLGVGLTLQLLVLLGHISRFTLQLLVPLGHSLQILVLLELLCRFHSSTIGKFILQLLVLFDS